MGEFFAHHIPATLGTPGFSLGVVLLTDLFNPIAFLISISLVQAPTVRLFVLSFFFLPLLSF